MKVGEIWAAGASKFPVLDLVPMEEDSDLFVGLLKVEQRVQRRRFGKSEKMSDL